MIFNIQILRSIAAMMVVWVHSQALIAGQGLLPESAGQFGYGGVDLFFVISGFIMVRITQDKEVSPFAFIKRRIQRVAPMYYFYILLAAALALTVPALFNSTDANVATVLKSLLFIPFEKSPDRVYPLYYVGWTLNFEMFFYLLFGASLILSKSARIIVVASVIMALTFVGGGVRNLTDYGVVSFFFTRPILLDFVLGMLVATAMPTTAPHPRPAMWWCLLTVGSAWFCLGGAVFPVGKLPIAPMTDTVLRFGVPSALILAGSIGLEQAGYRIRNQLMLRMGDASYSIYLSHYFLVGGVIGLAAHMGLDGLARVLLVPVTMTAAAAFGIANYYFIERPLAGHLDAYRWLGRAARAVVGPTE